MEDRTAHNGELDEFPALDDLDFKLDDSASIGGEDDFGAADSFAGGDFDLGELPALDDAPALDETPSLDDDFGSSSAAELAAPEQDAFELSGDAFADDSLSDDFSLSAETDADEVSAPDLSLLDGDGDESVSLTEDELENILGTTDDGFGEIPAEDLSAELQAGDAAELPDVDLAPISPPGASGELHPDEELGFDDFSASSEDAEALVIPELEAPDADGVSSDLLAGDDNEPIALSPDELDNIMSDVAPADAESDLPPLDLEGGMDTAALDFDMPESDLAELELESPTDALAPLDHEEDNITLSDDELSQVLLDSDLGETGGGDDELALSAGMLDVDENEPIALTPEELGNIISEVGEEGEAGLGEIEFSEQTPVFDEEPGAAPDMAAFESVGDEPTALSDNELSSILADTDASAMETRGGMFDDGAIAGLEPPPDVINLDDYGETAESAGAPALVAPARAAVAERVADESGVNRDELKRMISYLDGLFDQLPEDAIREFSRSEYFDLYKRIMDELGL